jgi:hypothetical protein
VTRREQQIEERRLFNRFAQVCPYGIVPGSEQWLEPPEPDVRCDTAKGPRRFELTEVVDERVAANWGLQATWSQDCHRLVGELPTQEQSRILAHYGNASIVASPTELLSKTALRKAARALIRLLTAPKAHLDGELPIQDVPALHQLFSGIRIRRGDYRGPSFGLLAPGPVDTSAVVSAVENKLKSKTYSPGPPIDLVVCYDFNQCSLAHVQWKPAVDALVSEHLQKSPFDRIWIADTHEPRVVDVIPPLDGI